MPHPSPSQCPRPPIFMPATFYDGSRELQGRQLSRGSRGSSSTKNVGTRHQSAFPNVSLFFFSSLSSFPFSSFPLFLADILSPTNIWRQMASLIFNISITICVKIWVLSKPFFGWLGVMGKSRSYFRVVNYPEFITKLLP